MNLYLQKLQKAASISLPLMFWACSAVATTQDENVAALSIGSGDVLSVTGGLFSVIAAILIAAYVYSKMQGPKIGGSSVINIIASQPLGPKERIVLVEIADTQFAIGMTTSNVQTLHVFDKPVVTVDEKTSQSGFGDKLKEALRSFGK